MRGLTLSLVALLSAAVFASPTPGGDCKDNDCKKHDDHHDHHDKPEPCHDCCLTGTIARKLADEYNYFFVNLNPAVAMATLTEDFKLYSDSDNIVEPNHQGAIIPAGAPTYHSRDEFIADQPSVGNVTVPNAFVNLDVFHDCSKIVARWVAPHGFPGKHEHKRLPVRGIDILETVSWNGHWKIRKVYSEYNNVAYLVDTQQCKICKDLEGPRLTRT